jgi:hypothetical protein
MDVAVLQRVIGGQNRSAGITEYGRNSLLFQTFPKNLRACFNHKIIRPVWRCLSSLKTAIDACPFWGEME